MDPLMSASQAVQYVQGHRNRPPEGWGVALALDFGADDGGGGETVDTAAVRARLEAIQAECDRDGLRYFEPTRSMTRLDMEAFARDIQKSLGLIYEHAGVALDALGKANGEPVEPPAPPAPTVLRGVHGSYPGHDPARDVYLGYTDEQVQWGPHHGLPLIAPVDCVIEAYQFPTPLGVFEAMDAETRERHRALFTDWGCKAPQVMGATLNLGNDARWVTTITPSQVMYVAVMRFAQPVGGLRLGHFGHVRQDIRTGRVARGETFAYAHDSGIRFEPSPNPVARAAHVHVAASASGALSPNGDIDGARLCEVMGWELTNLGFAPGPNEYSQANVWCAGRRYQDFVHAGRQPPPIPS